VIRLEATTLLAMCGNELDSKSNIIAKAQSLLNLSNKDYFDLSVVMDGLVNSNLLQRIGGKYRISPEGKRELKANYMALQTLMLHLYRSAMY
jgi:hypothetical protein